MALAAVTNGDNSNILIARVARETFGIEHVVARIYDPRRAAIYQRLGITTVATVAWTTDQVLRRLLPDETPPEWTDPTAQRVASSSARAPPLWAGQPLADLEEAVGGGRRASAGSARRSCRRRAPSPSRATCCTCAVADGASPPSTRPLAIAAGPRSTDVNVVIAGGGSVGRFIAEQLTAPATRC